MPSYRPIYLLSPQKLQMLKEYLDDFLKKKRIKPSKSPTKAPILFVLKKDGSLHLYIDYRGFNSVTMKNQYLLLFISEILDRIIRIQFFIKIDVKDAYHCIRIKEGDEWKTAFRTRYSYFEYLVISFGLTNALTIFQSYIYRAFYRLFDIFCIVYLDDILIFSKIK